MATVTVAGQVVGVREAETLKTRTKYVEVSLLQTPPRGEAVIVRVRLWNANGVKPKGGERIVFDEVRVQSYAGRNGRPVVVFDKFYERPVA